MMVAAKGEGVVDKKRLFDWGQRLEFIASMPSAFLESNRKDILEGKDI